MTHCSPLTENTNPTQAAQYANFSRFFSSIYDEKVKSAQLFSIPLTLPTLYLCLYTLWESQYNINKNSGA